jgi:hypothetical protein
MHHLLQRRRYLLQPYAKLLWNLQSCVGSTGNDFSNTDLQFESDTDTNSHKPGTTS